MDSIIKKSKMLIVEDEDNAREGLQQALQQKYIIYVSGNLDDALILIKKHTFDIILTDLNMPHKGIKSGIEIIKKALKTNPSMICIVMTAYGDIKHAVESIKLGAYDFLKKPIQLNKLELLLKKALKTKNNKKNDIIGENFIVKSDNFIKILEESKKVAKSKVSILLLGETGTGKEELAKFIHYNSDRKNNTLVTVHCAALPENLIENELFGHEKGAFTGANFLKKGRFEIANNGSLFLDEIGEINLSTQVKLLRFLETKTFQRLGSNTSIKVDARLICATHRNLEEMIKNNLFREDLFYRLNVITITIPPLRDRKEDIIPLFNFYLKKFSIENNRHPLQLKKNVEKILLSYKWPGNIRELKNIAESLVVLNIDKPYIDVNDLDSKFFNNSPLRLSQNNTDIKSENEKQLLYNALINAKGNKTIASKILGISRRTLHRKLKKWPDIDY